MATRQTRLQRFIWLTIAAVAAASGCSPAEPPPHPDYERILGLGEAFDPLVLRAVMSDDTNAVDAVVNVSGCEPVLDCFRLLEWEVVEASVSQGEFMEVKALVLPHLERIASFAWRRYGCRGEAREVERFRTWERENVRTWHRLHDEFELVVREDSIPVEDRIAWATGALPALDAALPGYAPFRARDRIAGLHEAAGRRDVALQAYREIVTLAMANEADPALCNYAGFVGALHPDPDSVYAYWRLGLETARRHELVYHQARLLSFIGSHYHDRGRLNMAEAYYAAGMSLYDQYPRSPMGYRFLLEAADRYRQLGWIDEAERAIDQADLLFERSAQWRLRAHGVRAVADGHRALLVLARGDARRAHALRRQVLPRLMDLELGVATGFMLDYAAEELRQSSLDACLETIEQALTLWPENERLDRYRRTLFARQAYVLAMLGRDDGARNALERFDSAAETVRSRDGFDYGPDERALIAVARACLDTRARSADMATVVDAVDGEVRAILDGAEPGAHRYLWLDQNAFLRDFYEGAVPGDVPQQLGVDLYWRELHASLSRPAQSKGSLMDQWRDSSRGMVRFAAAENAHIFVYSVRAESIYRYDVDDRRIERVRIEMPVTTLRELVDRAWHGLSTEPGRADSPVEPSLAETLSRLTHALLPAGPPAGRLFVVADGFLRRLPFEALNVSRNGYEPLLARSDVVYLSGIDLARDMPRGGHSVVLADPRVPLEIQRRIGGYRRLPGARAEAYLAAEQLPGARIATGDEATAQWLQQNWEGARYIHIATHALDDPNLPYYSLLALAGRSGTGNMTDVFLDVGDVLDADLGACELAILSGCGTGAPRAHGRSITPSFGDAFLDAGAAAVIETFWNVRDDVAAETMNAFIHLWRERQRPPAAALQAVRRDLALTRPHPYYWAAYSIEIAGGAVHPAGRMERASGRAE